MNRWRVIVSEVNFERSLYVACALTGASDEYIDGIENLKRTLEVVHGINVLHFLGLGPQSPLEVYEWDIEECVSKCSAFLGIYAGVNSDGRGYETRVAVERRIPMLGVALKTDRVSKVITGAYEKHDQPFAIVRNLQDDVPPMAARQFKDIYDML